MSVFVLCMSLLLVKVNAIIMCYWSTKLANFVVCSFRLPNSGQRNILQKFTDTFEKLRQLPAAYLSSIWFFIYQTKSTTLMRNSNSNLYVHQITTTGYLSVTPFSLKDLSLKLGRFKQSPHFLLLNSALWVTPIYILKRKVALYVDIYFSGTNIFRAI